MLEIWGIRDPPGYTHVNFIFKKFIMGFVN